MDTPLISVIVPVYNISGYLARCLDSILAQTYPNIEIIAVDDGSSDSSGEIMDAYAVEHSNVRTFHKENGGVTSARLYGVSKAHGDYIGFVDGDDTIEPDMYERLMHNLTEADADISHCGYQMVFPSRVDYYYNTGFKAIWDRETGLKELLSGERIEPGLWNKLYRKQLLDKLIESDRMDCSVRNTEDLLMNYWLFKTAGSSVYEDFCPYHYMIRKGSATSAAFSEQRLIDPLKVLRIIQNVCEDPALRPVILGRIVGTLIGLATMSDGEHKEIVSPHRHAARKELRELCPEILRGKYSTRTKVLTAWAAAFPDFYRYIHRVYARVRGTDRKYSVD